MRQVVHKPIMLSLWLLILSAASFTAVPGRSRRNPEPPPAQLEKSTLPAAGRQTTVLNVTRFGRYSILAAASREPRCNWSIAWRVRAKSTATPANRTAAWMPSWSAGNTRSSPTEIRRATGTVRLDLRPFAERNLPQPPQLIETQINRRTTARFRAAFLLARRQQRQYVILEAAGRSLADLRLWKDGNWLMDVHPVTQIIYPKEGQPLFSCRLNVCAGSRPIFADRLWRAFATLVGR